ncbi:hypothetical protein [Thermogemmatispora tikiterensis]|uniref:Uncharacterized protein n=1 Tax=Thermogemmatispora tikiterensis TaxID=1825093 RepID=A0A328VEF4_9CHLR|nr:hypothetical protein [Thermogemmatispora tikiterensis]RAQ95907.1 hypothetical protein A4R35_10200 [Thermogemmatispora tikiterensis]
MRFPWLQPAPFPPHEPKGEAAALAGDPLLVEIGSVVQLTRGKGDDDYDAPAAGYFDVPDPPPEPGGDDEGEERPSPDEEDEDEE